MRPYDQTSFTSWDNHIEIGFMRSGAQISLWHKRKYFETLSVAALLHKLPPEQRQRIDGLSDEEGRWTEEMLCEKREAYFLDNFKPLFNQLEYIRRF